MYTERSCKVEVSKAFFTCSKKELRFFYRVNNRNDVTLYTDLEKPDVWYRDRTSIQGCFQIRDVFTPHSQSTISWFCIQLELVMHSEEFRSVAEMFLTYKWIVLQHFQSMVRFSPATSHRHLIWYLYPLHKLILMSTCICAFEWQTKTDDMKKE